MYLIFGRDNCKYCDKAKELCERLGIDYTYSDIISGRFDSERMHRMVFNATGETAKTVPQIFKFTTISAPAQYIGGYDDLAALHTFDLDVDFNEEL